MDKGKGLADNDFNQSTDYPLVWKGESGTGDMAREMDALPLTELGIALGMGFLTELGIEPLIPQEALWHPNCEIRVVDEGLFIEAQLPGVKPADIDLQLVDGDLILSGKRKEKKKIKQESMVIRERLYGKFRRRIILPQGVKLETIKAGFENGLLQVLVPLPMREGLGMSSPKRDRMRIEVSDKSESQPLQGSSTVTLRGETLPSELLRKEGLLQGGAAPREEKAPVLGEKHHHQQQQTSSPMIFLGRETNATGSNV